MEFEQLLDVIYPYLGNRENTGKYIQHKDYFIMSVKDQSLIDLNMLEELGFFEEISLINGKVRLRLKEAYREEIIMANKKYEELSDKIVGLVGGKENITYLTHCITRLRFNLADKNKVDLEGVKNLPGAVGAQWSGDQLQVIIGQSVGDAYEMVCSKHGIAQQKSVNENLDNEKKKFSLAMIMDTIAGSITPLIPLLMAGGFLKIVVILGEQFGLLTPGVGTDLVLSFAGDAAFYFLPVFVGYSTARKVGANPALGLLMGAIFIHPQFISALAEGPVSVFAIPVYNAGYTSSIFPAFLSVVVLAPIQKFFGKHSPDSIRSITEPFFTMLIMIPLALCVLGPIGSFAGSYIATGIIWLYEHLGFVGVAVFSALCPLLVMTGMHSALMPYLIASLTSLGFEAIVLTGMIISNVDQGMACLAVAVKSKDKNRRSTAIGCAVTALLGGVTEPAMYGINLPLKTPLYGAMGGSLIGAAVAGILGAKAYVICGSAGLLGGIPIYLGAGMQNIIAILAGIGIGLVCTFIFTMIIYKEPQQNS